MITYDSDLYAEMSTDELEAKGVRFCAGCDVSLRPDEEGERWCNRCREEIKALFPYVLNSPGSADTDRGAIKTQGGPDDRRV